jgi:hypothetical protein
LNDQEQHASDIDKYTNGEGVNQFEIGGVKIKQRYLGKILSKPHQDAEVCQRSVKTRQE